jgi:hypothetical protein
MNNLEAKIFTDKIFKLICESETIEDLISIEKTEFESKFKMDPKSYPKIEFSINPSEIESLVDKGFLNHDFNLSEKLSERITDPLTKLLYSLSWKNGDLKKLKHIAKGISEVDDKHNTQDEALVFYQFGKYLTKKDGHPIIDQHVIRAFSISTTNNIEQIEKSRKIGVITKKEKDSIKKYKEWLVSDELSQNLKSLKDYTFYIDKILFATGKKIKFRKPKNPIGEMAS